MHHGQPCSSLNADFSSKLKRAVSSGDTTAVRRLLKGGVECNATFWVKSTMRLALRLCGETTYAAMMTSHDLMNEHLLRHVIYFLRHVIYLGIYLFLAATI